MNEWRPWDLTLWILSKPMNAYILLRRRTSGVTMLTKNVYNALKIFSREILGVLAALSINFHRNGETMTILWKGFPSYTPRRPLSVSRSFHCTNSMFSEKYWNQVVTVQVPKYWTGLLTQIFLCIHTFCMLGPPNLLCPRTITWHVLQWTWFEESR